MTPPIIINDHGSLELYGSIPDAEMDLEAIDVQNGEYEAFDSEARLLELETEEVRRRTLFGLLPITVDRVKISEKSSEDVDSERLCNLLREYLMNRKCPVQELKEASLRDLVVILEKTDGVKSFSK